LNYANIKYCDIANGVGVRTTLFVSGCRRHCPACFNPEAWSLSAGDPFTDAVADEISASLEPSYIAGLTLLGGEPFEPENHQVLLPFLERIRSEHPDKTIWTYSGFTLEELMGIEPPHAPYTTSPHTDGTERLLHLIDVLVDGPFILAEKDISLRFRGSRNQRLIDLKSTCTSGRLIEWRDEPLFATHTL
jgi:anaerobic ribonucleoside-triphosphate reductase activating protein